MKAPDDELVADDNKLQLNAVGSEDGPIGCITAKQDVYVYVRAADGSTAGITVQASAQDNALICNIAGNIMLVVGVVIAVVVLCLGLCIYCLCCRNKGK